MSSSIVKIGIDSIKTTVTEKERDINRLVKTFSSNKNNRKKIIGLDTERVQKGRKLNKTVLLQLCDGDNCLIVQLPDEDEDEGEGEDDNLPLSLFNFLNLPEFTFVGIGINKTMMRLESEFGLTCKNVVEIGPATWNLTNMTTDVKLGSVLLFRLRDHQMPYLRTGRNLFSIRTRSSLQPPMHTLLLALGTFCWMFRF
ncbi:putative ribonuclease H-like superfamily [Arabidopsis thaliana]